MRKTILISLFSLTVLFSNAQALRMTGSPEAPFSIGLRFGFTLPTAIGGLDGSKWINPGYVAGLVASFNINENFAIQPEVLFIQCGFQLTEKTVTQYHYQTYITNVQNNYLQLPILAKYRIGDDDFKFSFYGGPYVALALGGTFKLTSEEDGLIEEYKTTWKFGQKGLFSNYDVGAVVGTGVNITLGPGQIIGDVRCNLGVINIFAGGTSAYNLVPNLSLGYVFPLGN